MVGQVTLRRRRGPELVDRFHTEFLPSGIGAVFKADGDETRRKYSISEWWLEPNT